MKILIILIYGILVFSGLVGIWKGKDPKETLTYFGLMVIFLLPIIQAIGA